MSSRRHLVSRARNNEQSSPAQRSRQGGSEAPARVPTELPPYEPPCCPLSVAAKRKLEELYLHHDSSKYKKHIQVSIGAITDATADCNERLAARMKNAERYLERKRANAAEDSETADDGMNAEQVANVMSREVSEITTQAEKALRDLIDYRDELTMQGNIMREVAQELAAAPDPPPDIRRQRVARAGSDDEASDQEEEIDVVADVPGVSAIDKFNIAKETYANRYAQRTMAERYADHNDYKNFKRVVHEAQFIGDEQPPLPHARTWFPEENGPDEAGSSRRRRNNTTDNTNDADSDSDDDVVIAGEKKSLHCPLSAQIFKEPYSNHKCNHTFEKYAIEEYMKDAGVAFTQPGARSQRGPKQVKCPATGCEVMLGEGDFFIDVAIQRQVKRAERKELQDAEDDEEDDELAAPRGTQRTRPEEIDDEDSDGIEIDDEEDRRKHLARVKQERAVSSGPSQVPTQRDGGSDEEADAMEID